jgi:hypothetical protein
MTGPRREVVFADWRRSETEIVRNRPPTIQDRRIINIGVFFLGTEGQYYWTKTAVANFN